MSEFAQVCRTQSHKERHKIPFGPANYVSLTEGDGRKKSFEIFVLSQKVAFSSSFFLC
jgi:hypothetical protein